MLAGIAWLVSLVLAACSPAGRPLVAEVYYDAIGDDEGAEFVELLNPGAAPYDVGGARLEAGDGAGSGRWTLRWTAPVGTTIPAGGRFVVGGAKVVPAADAVVELALQNGPDAVRLVWPDGAVETVGYGASAFPEYACGAPAADVASGQSLARIPDTADQGSNAADFRAANPTPGRANLPRRSAAWIAGTLAVDPEQPAAGALATLRGQVVNAGAESWLAGALELVVTERAGGPLEVARETLAAGAAPGETLDVAVTLPGSVAGDRLLLAELALAGAEPPAAVDSLRCRVGPGPVEITEIQFHPTRGEGEWVEVRNRSGGRLELGGYVMLDRGTTRGHPDVAAACDADSLVVFAQDRAALLAAYPGVDPARVWSLKPWPALNNTDGDAGVADAVRWRDAADLACDRVDYSAAIAPVGVPIERGPQGLWRAALDPRGSPLAPGREPAGIAGAFDVATAVLPASSGTARLVWALPWREAKLRVDAFDLAGRLGGSLLAETRVAGRGERDVPTASLAPGLWVLVLRASQASGDSTVRATRVLRLTGAWR